MRVVDRLHPSLVLVGTFGAAVLLGTVLLALPDAARGERLGLVDAFFMATSAVCVTGLTVVDPGTRFTTFGQVVTLGLVQAGGLGIMTFALFFASLAGRRISFHDRMILQDAFHHSPTSELRRLLGYVFGFTIAVELAGALLLLIHFAQEMPLGDAAWYSGFHAITAFCNAGFSLFSDSLISRRDSVLLNLTITFLVIVGGLGFMVNLELRDRLLRRVRGDRPRTLSLHAKLVLVVTAALLVLGAVGFAVLEWNNVLRPLSLGDKLLAIWFQSVTPRTAGFNTVDYGQATAGTLFFTIFLMFVGASPGSTGGGIKTTVLGLMVVLVASRWRGFRRVLVFRRTVPVTAIDRALAVSLLSWLLASAVLGVLTVTEQGLAPADRAGPSFVQLMFESVSAFGTVGLSTGITAQLSAPGKLALCFLMFVGRVGPLTAALAIGRRKGVAEFRFAEENVMVG